MRHEPVLWLLAIRAFIQALVLPLGRGNVWFLLAPLRLNFLNCAG